MNVVRKLAGIAALFALAQFGTGCVSLSVLQEARTLPPGRSIIGFGLGTGLYIDCLEYQTWNPATGRDETVHEPVAIYGMDEQVFYRTGLGNGLDFGFMYAPPASFRFDLKYMFLDAERFAGSLALGGRIFGSGSQVGRGSGQYYQGEIDTPVLFTGDITSRFAITFGAKNIAIFRGIGSSNAGASASSKDFLDVAGVFIAPTIRAGRKFSIILEAGWYKILAMDRCNPNDLAPIPVFNIGFSWKSGRAEVTD